MQRRNQTAQGRKETKKAAGPIAQRVKGLFKCPEVPPSDHVELVRVKLLFPIHGSMIQLLCFVFRSRNYSNACLCVTRAHYTKYFMIS